jgi:lipopolysaccharide heptosyltransferase II
MKPYNNILIVRTDRIGDVILTTPAVAALRKAYPKARLSMLVAPLTRDLIAGHPDLHEVLVDDRKGIHRGLLGFLRLIRALRQRRFDMAIVFHTKKRTNSLCFFAGIPERVGYNHKLGFFLTQKIKDTRPQGLQHESEYCLDVLRFLGIPADSEGLYVSVHEADERWAEKFLGEHRIEPGRLAVIHPGASDPSKQWPAGNFRAVIDVLQNKYALPVCVIGASGIKRTAAEIERDYGNVLDLVGQTSVGQLVSLLKRSRILISNDSGPVHIAAALNIPVISIFTRNQPGINPERWRPLNPNSKVISPQENPAVSPAVSAVLEAADTLLKRVSQSP